MQIAGLKTKWPHGVYIYEWLHKPQDLKAPGILLYYAFITLLLRFVTDAWYFCICVVLGSNFASKSRRIEFQREARIGYHANLPHHYPRNIRATSANRCKWVDEVFWEMAEWRTRAQKKSNSSKTPYFIRSRGGRCYYAFITDILRLIADRRFHQKTWLA